MAAGSNGKILSDFKKDLKAAHTKSVTTLTRIAASAKKSGDQSLMNRCRQEKQRLNDMFKKLMEKVAEAHLRIRQESARQTDGFKEKMKRVELLKTAVDADSLLLEIKRKDLKQKAGEIEAAYNEISKKNLELIRQKHKHIYTSAMSYVTLEVEINHGKVVTKGPSKLPEKASGLLTIFQPDTSKQSKLTPAEALDALQKHLRLDEKKAAEWVTAVREARR